jgi:membrane protein implicated in regulation of membrane protease activity
MIYVKSIAFGIAAIGVSVAVAIVIVLWPVMQMSGNWHEAISLTALGTVTDSTTALLIFAAAFYWEFRRLSKRESLPSERESSNAASSNRYR